MAEYGVRPLNARSLVLSVLLGLPEPRLPAAALNRLADVFGIAAGTMRTAISRMVAAGELSPTDHGYELHGRLLARKAAQDIGRRRRDDRWDGSWWVVTTVVANRALAHRREFRAAMANGRMGELRPDTWMRPGNLPAPDVLDGTILVRGTVEGADGAELANRLWDLTAIERRCRELLAAIVEKPRGLPDATLLAAAVVRFLRDEPLLPAALTPPGWQADELRERFVAFDRDLGRALRAVLATR